MLIEKLSEEKDLVQAAKKLPKDSADHDAIIKYLYDTYSGEIMNEMLRAKKGTMADKFYRTNKKKYMLPVFGFLGFSVIALIITTVFTSYLQGIDNKYAIIIGIPVILVLTLVPLGFAVKHINDMVKDYLVHVIDIIEFKC